MVAAISYSNSVNILFESVKKISLGRLDTTAKTSLLAGALIPLFFCVWPFSAKRSKENPWELRASNPLLIRTDDSILAGITKMAIFLLSGGIATYALESFFRFKELFQFSAEDKIALHQKQISYLQLLQEKMKSFLVSFFILPKSILSSFSDAYSWSLRYGSLLFLKSDDAFVIKIAKLALIIFTAGMIFPLVECMGRLIELLTLTPEEQARVDRGEISYLRIRWEKAKDLVLGLSLLIPELVCTGLLATQLEKFYTAPQKIDTIFHRFDKRNFTLKFLWQGALFSHIVFFGPLLEEWLFRDYFYSWIEKKQAQEETSWKTLWQVEKIPPNAWHQKVTRIFITSVCFGVAHLSIVQGWANLPIFIFATFFGMILAILREYTKKTTASETLHCAHNFTVSVAKLLF